MIYYFAYGSNLHPVRLIERVASARLLGIARHARHRLSFNKKSTDGSGKCNVLNTDSERDVVYGAIYRLEPGHKAVLDEYEGLGQGYIDAEISVQYAGQRLTCFTYLAQASHIVPDLRPYHWYKQLVLLGARYQQFPDMYIGAIDSVESVDDPDAGRRHEKNALIERIIRFNG